MLRACETLRVYTLVLTVPVTALWARALGPATGALLIATHAALVLFYAAWAVRHDLGAGAEPRLGLVRRWSAVSVETLDIAIPIGFVMVTILALSLMVSNFWIGVGALLAFAAALWHGRQPARDRLARIELIAPVGLLAGPGLLFHLHAWAPGAAMQALEADAGAPAEFAFATGHVVRSEVISAPALAATLLAAAVMLVVILLCLARDHAADERDGYETTATRLGRDGAVALASVWILGVTLMTAIGVGVGWWHWSAAALVGWGAIGTVAALTARRDEWAVGAWMAGGSLASLVAAISV